MHQLGCFFEAFAWQFIANLCRLAHRFKPLTIDKHTKNLFYGSLPLIECYAQLPISHPSEMQFDHNLEVYKRVMEFPGLSLNYRSSHIQTAKKFIKFLMNSGIVKNDESILEVYLQKREGYHLPRVLTSEQEDLITAGHFSDDPFIQLRQQCAICVIGLANGGRMEVELEQLLRSDVYDKETELIIIITGKSGIRRPISVCEYDKKIIRSYLHVRDRIVASYQINEPAFFIKRYPSLDEMTGIYSLALTRSGHYHAIRRFLKSHDKLTSVQPYDFRRHAITRMVLIAAICQIPIEEVANYCGNSVKIIRQHYNRCIGLYRELFSRRPDQLIPFVRNLISHELTLYSQNPQNIEYRASAEILEKIIGRCRMFLLLNNLPDSQIFNESLNLPLSDISKTIIDDQNGMASRLIGSN
jgi:site-specific recombinase XerD